MTTLKEVVFIAAVYALALILALSLVGGLWFFIEKLVEVLR